MVPYRPVTTPGPLTLGSEWKSEIPDEVMIGMVPAFRSLAGRSNPLFKLTTSPSFICRHSDAIPQPPQILSDLRFQPHAFGELFVKLRGQPPHFFDKGFVIFFAFFRANVPSRRQHIIVPLNLFQ